MLPFSESGQSYLVIQCCRISFKNYYWSKMMQDCMETCDSSWVIFRTRHFQFDFNISSVTNVRIPWRLFTCLDAYHPVNLFSLFHEDSPCLTSTKVYLLRLDVSFLMAHATAVVSLNPELRRNIMRLVCKRQKYNVIWSQRFYVCMTALDNLSCIIDDEEPKLRSIDSYYASYIIWKIRRYCCKTLDFSFSWNILTEVDLYPFFWQ